MRNRLLLCGVASGLLLSACGGGRFRAASDEPAAPLETAVAEDIAALEAQLDDIDELLADLDSSLAED